MHIAVSECATIPVLKPYIESYWFGYFNVHSLSDFNQQVLPNACIELIVHLTEDHCSLKKKDHSYTASPPFTLIGVYQKPYNVKFHKKVATFGIRFYPDGFRNIFGVPPAEFLSSYEDGVDVIGMEFNSFCTRLTALDDHSKRIDCANQFLTAQLMKHKQENDFTHLAMQLIRRNAGMINFEELTKQVPLSIRQLQRVFKNNYGLRISDYMRITRLNAINKYMLEQPASLTELAYKMDFTDQSHFIREFKNYTNIAPRQFLKCKEDYIVNAS